MHSKEESTMKYETPKMQKVAFEAKENVANENEWELDFSDTISNNSMPNG